MGIQRQYAPRCRGWRERIVGDRQQERFRADLAVSRQDEAESARFFDVATQFRPPASGPIERHLPRQIFAQAKALAGKITDDLGYGRHRHVPNAIQQPAPSGAVVAPVTRVWTKKD